MRRRRSPDDIAQGVLSGEVAAVAQAITAVENDRADGHAVLETVFPHTGRAHLIGITGPPGAGKSSLVNEMVRMYRAAGRTVAVLAIDPSSPITGGATLGDRIRMLEWHADPGVFVRSMASRRFGGGLARHALTAAHVFDAAGYDPILIETVGTGQDEVAVAALAHSTVLVQVPGLGDGIQALKAGALEIGDVLVVSKGDRPDAQTLSRDLRRLQTLHDRDVDPAAWVPPVVTTSAVHGTGFDTLSAALADHVAWLHETGEWEMRTRTALATEVTSRVQYELMRRIERSSADAEAVLGEVLARRVSPVQASDSLLRAMRRDT